VEESRFPASRFARPLPNTKADIVIGTKLLASEGKNALSELFKVVERLCTMFEAATCETIRQLRKFQRGSLHHLTEAKLKGMQCLAARVFQDYGKAANFRGLSLDRLSHDVFLAEYCESG
jgi:hypothetical protein